MLIRLEGIFKRACSMKSSSHKASLPVYNKLQFVRSNNAKILLWGELRNYEYINYMTRTPFDLL